jgi:deoxycytidylate deaminase
MSRYHKWLNVAVLEAQKSTMNNKYGCVLVMRNKIIAKGYNYETHISTLSKSCVLCC